ncbi:MAG: nuclear transport factor 2 family protein [Leptolyngbyaceae cyanobacterium bins.302]|nr:nuclear transport factor 2 family protein [Leptolyngbyaceae cyanobacterium bins.302]
MTLSVETVFDERYYRWANPDVSAAIDSGQYKDGLEHYNLIGRSEGRSPSGYYNEQFYLQNNPDVAQAVQAGAFDDGLDHFLSVGYTFNESRSTSDLIDPDWIYDYLTKKDPDTAFKLQTGEFSVIEYFTGLPKGKQHELTAERAFLSLWNDKNFDIIDQLTTGADFIDRNVFQVLPGPYDGGTPGKLIGGPEIGGKPGTEGIKQTALLFIEAMPDIVLEQKEFAYDGDKLFIRWEENGTQVNRFGEGSYSIGGRSLADVLGVPALSGPTPRKFQGLIVAYFNPEGKMYERLGYPLAHETTANFIEMGVPLGDISNRIRPVGSLDPVESQALNLVKSTYAAFQAGDIPTVLNAFDPAITWKSQYSAEIPFSGVYQGTSGVLDYLSDVTSSTTILAFNPTTYTTQGNTVIVRGSEEIAVNSTNLTYTNSWVHVWKLSNGKVVEITTYNDTAAVDAAFGLETSTTATFDSAQAYQQAIAATSIPTVTPTPATTTASAISFDTSDASGRITLEEIFDETYYLWAYPEVKAAIDRGEFDNALDHYLTVGRSEGRNPSGYYNEDYYLAKYPDVVQAICAGLYQDGLDHFLKVGQNFSENRSSSDVVDSAWIYNYLVKEDPTTAAKIARGELTAVDFYAGLPKGKQYELTAERAFLGLWNDKNFDIIDQLTTGAAFIDRNVFQVRPGPYDGGTPGKLIGGPEIGGQPGTEGIKQTALLFIEAMPDIVLDQKEFGYDGEKLWIRWEENGTQVNRFGEGSYSIGGRSLADVLGVPALSGPTPRKFQGLIVAYFNPEGKMYERLGYPIAHETLTNFLEMGVPLGDIANRVRPVGQLDPIESRSLKLVQDTYAAFGQGNIDAVLNALDEDITWTSRYSPDVPFNGVFQGRAGVLDYLGKVNSSVTLLSFNPQTFTVQDQTVIVTGFEEGVVNATNRTYTNRWAHVWQLDSGKVSQITTYNDSAAVENAFEDPLALNLEITGILA